MWSVIVLRANPLLLLYPTLIIFPIIPLAVIIMIIIKFSKCFDRPCYLNTVINYNAYDPIQFHKIKLTLGRQFLRW